MKHFVYLLISKHKKKIISYVGYTKDIKKRLNLHNISKGAKFTKGKKWILFYKETYKNKTEAMSREFTLKKDRKFRNSLKAKFLFMNNKKILNNN